MEVDPTPPEWAGFGVMLPTWSRHNSDSSGGSSPSSSSDESQDSAEREADQKDLATISINLLEVLLNADDLHNSTLLHAHLSPRAVTVGTFPDPTWSTNSRCALVHKIRTQRVPEGGPLYVFDIHSSCVTASIEEGARGRKAVSVVPAAKRPLFKCTDETMMQDAAREWVLQMRWRWVGRKKWKMGCDKPGHWVCVRLETMTNQGGFGFW